MSDTPINNVDPAEVYRRWMESLGEQVEKGDLNDRVIREIVQKCLDCHAESAGDLMMTFSWYYAGELITTLEQARAVYTELRRIALDMQPAEQPERKEGAGEQRTGWRYFSEGAPSEGERVLVKLLRGLTPVAYAPPDVARFDGGKWCNDNWHCDVPADSRHRWCPIPVDEVSHG